MDGEFQLRAVRFADDARELVVGRELDDVARREGARVGSVRRDREGDERSSVEPGADVGDGDVAQAQPLLLQLLEREMRVRLFHRRNLIRLLDREQFAGALHESGNRFIQKLFVILAGRRHHWRVGCSMQNNLYLRTRSDIK